MKVEEPAPSFEYTYADYLKWKFQERLELFRGKIYKLSAPGAKHQEVSIAMASHIFNHLKGRQSKVFSAPFDVRLPKPGTKKDSETTTVVQPDLCVICDESKLDEKGCCDAPDLIIEILSPGNSRKEIRLKYELYEEAGVKEYRIIQPAEETVSVLILNKSGKFEGASLIQAETL